MEKLQVNSSLSRSRLFNCDGIIVLIQLDQILADF